MKIAIIGSTGVLGTAFVTQSQRFGFEYKAFNRDELSDDARFEELLTFFKPDYIVCTIAIPSNRLCMVDPAKAVQSNLAVPLKIARIIKKLNIRMVLFSSHGVFDPLDKIDYFHETFTPNAKTFYGLLKIELERTIIEMSSSLFTMIRLPSMFGTRIFPGEMGACERILCSLETNQDIEARIDMFDSYTSADDVASFVLEYSNEISHHQLLHFANEGILSMLDFANHAKATMGSKSMIAEASDGAGRIYCSALMKTQKINDLRTNSSWEALETFIKRRRI